MIIKIRENLRQMLEDDCYNEDITLMLDCGKSTSNIVTSEGKDTDVIELSFDNLIEPGHHLSQKQIRALKRKYIEFYSISGIMFGFVIFMVICFCFF